MTSYSQHPLQSSGEHVEGRLQALLPQDRSFEAVLSQVLLPLLWTGAVLGARCRSDPRRTRSCAGPAASEHADGRVNQLTAQGAKSIFFSTARRHARKPGEEAFEVGDVGRDLGLLQHHLGKLERVRIAHIRTTRALWMTKRCSENELR